MIFIRIFFILFLIAIITIPLIMIQVLVKISGSKLSEKIPQFFHKILLYCLGIRVFVKGVKQENVPLIITSNHLSWIDIPVIGSCFPCYFIAKSEISGWPIFGFLAKLQNTIFVNRTAKGKDIQTQVNDIEHTLLNKKTVILFPEGTTSDGNKVLPFKSALMAVAQAKDEFEPVIQPMIIKYIRHSGMPIGRYQKPNIAWYGDTDLVPHLLNFLQFYPVDVEITLGSPIYMKDFTNRREIAHHLENFIRISYTQQSHD